MWSKTTTLIIIKVCWNTLAIISFSSKSMATPHSKDDLRIAKYLRRFGYLDDLDKGISTENNNVDDDDKIFMKKVVKDDKKLLKKALKDFQSFVGLRPTGILDEETAKLMSTPRCGVKDKGTEFRRFVTQGSIWRSKKLTYKISTYSKHVSKTDLDTEMHTAITIWSTAADLNFINKKNGRVHININFTDYAEPGDFENKVLAFAYYPNFGGAAFFYDIHNWTINSTMGTNIFYAAAHEFGHALGLRHSTDPEALMYAYHKNPTFPYSLPLDDVYAIQSLYGRKKGYDKQQTKNMVPPVPHNQNKDTQTEGRILIDTIP